MESKSLHIHWFRRDLRLKDHRGLLLGSRSGRPVLSLFIFDRTILEQLDDPADRRVQFIWHQLNHMREQLESAGSALLVFHGHPSEVWKQVLERYPVGSVSVVRDYEPYARKRDRKVGELLNQYGIQLTGVKDQVIFEKSDVLSQAGEPYKVFTPYSKQWKQSLNSRDMAEATVPDGLFYRVEPAPFPSLESLGFRRETSGLADFPSSEIPEKIIRSYDQTREVPALEGTTRLGVHLRFGTLSIRTLVRYALRWNDIFLKELIWREFYQMVLWHHPESPDRAIKPAYDRIEWEENPDHFLAWCEGRTGYPMVDAGMRELNQTGFMHNRVRMITASFLTKHLMTDWRKGERYFAARLLDYEMASNVGGWQWAAGSGHDAAPWFRIFNPTLQQKRYDPEGHYIRTWIPEFGTSAYPEPIVEHKLARKRALSRYKKAVAETGS
ncbi:MAG: deoxyribodipyrimidine photo-lyase [Balneolaceae bacterium]